MLTKGEIPKICYLADAKSPHTVKWVSYFVEEGYDVHVVSLRDGEISGAVVHAVPMIERLGKLNYLLAAGWVVGTVRRIKPDLLHAHYATSYGLLGRMCKIHPFIVSVWGSDVLDGRLLNRFLVRGNLRAADAITATSKMLATATAGLSGINRGVEVIPFGVDTELFKPGVAPVCKRPEIVVGTTKSLEDVYGIEHLIKAFALLCQPFDNLRLMIVGGGTRGEHLQELSRELRVDHRVTFFGPVKHADIPGFLARIDIFVVPSLQESFGVAAVEAASMGLPVVASNVGGLPEVVVDNLTGFLVPPGDAVSLSDAIQKLVINPDLREKMGRSGRKFVKEQYEWRVNAQQMRQLYKKLLG